MTCLGQRLVVIITARKHPSKLMKDFGHTLSGQIFLSVTIKHLQLSHINHSDTQLGLDMLVNLLQVSCLPLHKRTFSHVVV